MVWLPFACAETQVASEGEGCTSPLDCKPGLICAVVSGGSKRVCTRDLSGTGGTPAMPVDAGRADAEERDVVVVPPPLDAGMDATMMQEAGPKDSGTQDAQAEAGDGG